MLSLGRFPHECWWKLNWAEKRATKKHNIVIEWFHLNTESLKVDFLWAVTFNIKKEMLHFSFHEMSSNILSVMYHVSCHYRCHAQTGLRTWSKHCGGELGWGSFNVIHMNNIYTQWFIAKSCSVITHVFMIIKRAKYSNFLF